MKPLHPAEQFSRDVQTGTAHAGTDISAMCCAHNEDRSVEKEPYFPFQFDEATALAYVEALSERVLPPNLSPVEQFFIWRAFGWVRKSDGSRRYAQEAF